MSTWIVAALSLPLLLYLPGLALLYVARATPDDSLERNFERVAASALFSGWLALLLAALGVFSLPLQLGLTLALAAGAVVWARRAGRDPWGEWARSVERDSLLVYEWHQRRERGERPRRRWRDLSAANWRRADVIPFLAIGLVALLLVARPFEVVLGVRDAGVYANAGFAIARTGAIVQHDATLAALGADAAAPDPSVAGPAAQAVSNFTIGQTRERYIATRLRAAGFFVNAGDLPAGRVVPQGLHLLPAWIGLLTAAGGPLLGLFAPGLLGVLGAWSLGMLGRRLAGPWVGALAFLFLALNGAQVWFARYSTAETTAQFLIWSGLYFFAKAMDGRREGEEPEGAGTSGGPTRAMVVAAALAGVAIGQVALARIDAFLLGPAIAYLIYCWVARRWGPVQTALALGLGAMLLHAGLHIAFVARAYFFDTGHDRLRQFAITGLLSLPFLTPDVREVFLSARGSGLARPGRLWLELVAVAAGVGALLLLRWRSGLLHWAEAALVARRRPLLTLVCAVLLLLSAYAYVVRPAIVDADMLFNTRGGWSDPLARDPALVALDVREGRMTVEEARLSAGVALDPGQPFFFAGPDLTATAELRERLRAERGPWRGPFSNQTLNWLRLQGYVGAPIRLPVELWYNEYNEMSWWERLTVDPATLPSEPAPINDKYKIPLANLVRVGWYLSPLGVVLGCVGYALWWRRGLSRASWLFLGVAFIGTFFYVRQTYGTSDQHYIYILRRFVPIAYPALSLCAAYALAALAGWGRGAAARLRLPAWLGPGLAGGLAALLVAFFAITNRPIYRHAEYAGALEQTAAAARLFTPGRDVVLLRGGAPIYAEGRDVPDLIATPLRFAYGVDAFTVKSTAPGEYAAELAAQVRRWRDQGREVYLAESASGGAFALPGFALEPAGAFQLDLPEFEQLTDQKPRNVSRLVLPFVLYRAVPAETGRLATAAPPLAPDDFAAQVTGLYRPEQGAEGRPYSWTNGEALLRLPWAPGATAPSVALDLAAGERPPHLGPARLCVEARPEAGVWPRLAPAPPPVELGCFDVAERPATYTLRLDPVALPPAAGGTLLLRLASPSWVPAAEDPRLNDRRAVGVQFLGLQLGE